MSKMTVSQGLRAVADLKGRIAKHKEHAQGSVSFIEKNEPAFNFHTEMEGYNKSQNELIKLQTAIAVSNATTEIEWKNKKILVAQAIRILEETKGKKKFIDELNVSAQAETVQDNLQNRLAISPKTEAFSVLNISF